MKRNVTIQAWLFLVISVFSVSFSFRPAQAGPLRSPETFSRAVAASAKVTEHGWWQNSVFYEIFVRSFQDSNGDGIGDLNGIRQRLPELKHLGIDALWLTPIFPSPSYHGYDATDFLAINPEFGTMEDFENLVKDAHSRGIKIVLDVAINHTSIQHPWFKKFPGRYMWDSSPHYKQDHWFPLNDSFFYGTFGNELPDLNWYAKDVRREVKNIFKFWAAKGVDGFRLDAARYFAKGPEGESDTAETHRIIADLVKETRASYPNTYFVGEIWADHETISSYVKPRQLAAAFDFPSSYALIESLHAGTSENWTDSLRDAVNHGAPLESVPPFLTNHDMVRVATQVHGNLAQLKLGAISEMVLPSAPYLYYGEEIGMLNDVGAQSSRRKRSDISQRTPMLWSSAPQHGFSSVKPWADFSDTVEHSSVEEQTNSPTSLWQVYHQMIALRHQEAALNFGDFAILSIDPRVAIFTRQFQKEWVAIVLNFSKQKQDQLEIPLPQAAGLVSPLFGQADVTCTGATCTVQNLDGVSGFLFKVKLGE